MVGHEIPLKVIEVNQRQRRLILSERAAWREWRKAQKERLLEDLQEGDVRKGTVTSLTNFGAFVDLGGADGLIHISELSWDRGKRPEDVLQVGQEVEVKVIHVDRERKRIGLSLKQLKPDPWESIEDRYVIGQYVDVEITNLTKFGAFARLEEGVEGLIHISELSEENIEHPSQVVQPGQVVTAQIINLDGQRRRVGLSLRRVPEHLRGDFEAIEESAAAATEVAVLDAEPTPAAEAAIAAEPATEAMAVEEGTTPAAKEAPTVEEAEAEAQPEAEEPTAVEVAPSPTEEAEAVAPPEAEEDTVAVEDSTEAAEDEVVAEEHVEAPVGEHDDQAATSVTNGDDVALEAEPVMTAPPEVQNVD